ncbi:SDR family NAD(P)-dependent oxidoreductase, partial [Myxococcota bacterium]|nr:SDR family NAD(P)-dependent oxidoreductase [Myxococcota bacterium]
TKSPYTFDRRFLFRILAMGHSQFAELIGARGPNTQVNTACASTTQAVALAEDWIRLGRCRRVVVIAADDATSDHLMEWIGAGFLASGAAATDEIVEEAALPFDRRRHGMIVGMGAAALVVESADAAKERGLRPIVEVLSTATANSAFHGTRLDVEHITGVMEKLVADAEKRWGISRGAIADRTVFVSHETYTPARGGSAAAEIHALRAVFRGAADHILIANTKGFTGHPMGVGIEDVLAVKTLETGVVPEVPNWKEIDPELGRLNLSKGGSYPIEYAIRLAAGFGSQISMSLLRWVRPEDGHRPRVDALGYQTRIEDERTWRAWLASIATDGAEPEVEVVRRTLRLADKSGFTHDKPTKVKSTEGAKHERAPAWTPPPTARAELGASAAGSLGSGAPRGATSLGSNVPPNLGSTPGSGANGHGDVISARAAVPSTAAPTRPAATDAVPPGAVTTPAPIAKAPAPRPAEDPVRTRVLAIVSEKTGYPSDMLDPDLDLEADLGVDTVKQAELFAAVRGEWNIPRDETLKLREFPTLNHVVRFVYTKRPDLAAPTATTAIADPVPSASVPQDSVPQDRSLPSPAAPSTDAVRARVLAIVSEKTGYPADMLDPDLDLEADLGVDTVKQAELFAAVRGEWNIPRDETLKLREFPTLNHVVRFVYTKRPDLAAPSATPAITATPAVAASAPGTTPSAPVTTATAASTPTATTDAVRAKVLAIVSEKTGYPADMLDPELDLEADLGVDTVKQAELFAAVRGEWNIPRDENLKLRDFPTLNHVVAFVYAKRPDLAPGTVAAAAPIDTATTAPTAAPVPQDRSPATSLADGITAADRMPRRVPVPVLRASLDASKATGVELTAGQRVVILSDGSGTDEALATALAARGVEALVIDWGTSNDALVAKLGEWKAAGPITGVYALGALHMELPLGAMDLAAWREALRLRVKTLFLTMRTLGDAIGPRGTFLVSATRLGGLHGFDPSGAFAPLGGAVTGFTKAYAREKPDALVKAVDFEPMVGTEDLARALVAETLRDPGAVEIGLFRGMRHAIGFVEEPATDGRPGMTLDANSVFVVTGAAGSITSAIVQDLARASGGTFYLLDLVPEPDRNDPDLARLDHDRDGLRRDLFERLKAKGEKATPAIIEKRLGQLERSAAALAAIRGIEAAGGKARWFAGDLRDPAAVGRAIDAVRAEHGKIDVLLHAGGLEISRFITDKEPAEFDLVFDVKADGWFNLLRAIGELPLGATVAFSSVAGRFGNAGQTDYASANDLLAKTSSSFRHTRPSTRGITIDWTAWGGIGMATRGSIPKMMEAAGIEMLPPESGIPTIRRELTAGARRQEIVVAGKLGILANEREPETGGLDPEALGARGPMITSVRALGVHRGLELSVHLDPSEPFLDDHRIDGTPVLPGVMSIEIFVEAARVLVPSWTAASVEDVSFLAPFKLYRDEPRDARVQVTLVPDGDALVARCALWGDRKIASKPQPETTLHATARVRLVRSAPAVEPATPFTTPPEPVARAEGIYRVYFHGPAYRVLDTVHESDGRIIGAWSTTVPQETQTGVELVATPRLVELCFQTAGLHELRTSRRMGLPTAVEEIRFLSSGTGSRPTRLFAVVEPDPNRPGWHDARVVDEEGVARLALRGYRTAALPSTVAPDLLAGLGL